MDETWISPEVDEALRRQDEALAQLEKLRATSRLRKKRADQSGGKRRQSRRWPVPEGIVVELFDGDRWATVPVVDIGVGGVRVATLPNWMIGPAPCRLSSPTVEGIIVLCDVMWRTGDATLAGLRFEFDDADERDTWTEGLIDALLARFSVG
ncbi:MAG: PilZ domain-containing protein [Armatimonadaceae bacterium]|jgi:hypothetical protein